MCAGRFQATGLPTIQSQPQRLGMVRLCPGNSGIGQIGIGNDLLASYASRTEAIADLPAIFPGDPATIEGIIAA
ncbi:hypothetical protein BKG84_07280 [Mycobacteroides chelonae]|uniref:Uncharacterized protein n=2 Tax=Mycobacteroides chelonae TaxID=1774 RepID=A0A1S1M484_MYCCH|nr:hypothetical protein BKG84_07280 [Mycobacteroides chelonae]